MAATPSSAVSISMSKGASTVFTSSRLMATSSTSSSRTGRCSSTAEAASGGAARARAVGRVTSNQKVEPSPSRLLTPTSPPISSTIRLQMASPRPVPPKRRETETSAWVKRSKTLGSCSAGMPTPVSVTSARSRAVPSPAGACETRSVTDPWAVNLTALERKLSSTWRSRLTSPLTRPAPSALTDSVRPLAAAWPLSRSITAPASTAGSNGAGSRSTAPASRREKSRTPLTSSSRVSLASPISRAWRTSGPSSRGDCFNTPAKPMMALSGVRSSWVMLARKSDLAAAAASAATRASISSASSSLRRWMLRATLMT